jgi:hypothetical protein
MVDFETMRSQSIPEVNRELENSFS